MNSAPSVVVELPLEGRPVIRIVAFTDRDEARLRAWLEGRNVSELLEDARRLVDVWCEAA